MNWIFLNRRNKFVCAPEPNDSTKTNYIKHLQWKSEFDSVLLLCRRVIRPATAAGTIYRPIFFLRVSRPIITTRQMSYPVGSSLSLSFSRLSFIFNDSTSYARKISTIQHIKYTISVPYVSFTYYTLNRKKEKKNIPQKAAGWRNHVLPRAIAIVTFRILHIFFNYRNYVHN